MIRIADFANLAVEHAEVYADSRNTRKRCAPLSSAEVAMLRKMLASVMATISIAGVAVLGMGATSSAATQMAPLAAGSPATVNIDYNHNGASLVVWVSGFKVSSWTGCRSTTVNRQTYEICAPSFSFSTAAAPAAPTSSNAYPVTVAFYNGVSRGAISYSNKATLLYLGDYYK